MLRIIILTSSLEGTAANHTPALLKSGCCEVVMVIQSRNVIVDKKKHYLRKLKKLLHIGIFGALNGIRMRRWYNQAADAYYPADRLDVTCARHNIPLHLVDAVNSDQTRALFRQANADLGISLGNGYIPKSVFSIPKSGMINIHHEILPDYQNAQGVIWQLYNGSTTTGFTIHRIDSKIDHGAILYQQTLPITFRNTLADTVAYTFAQNMIASTHGLAHVVCHFEELVKTAKMQGKGTNYTTPGLMKFFRILKMFRQLNSSRA